MAVNHLVWIKFSAGVPTWRVNCHIDALKNLSLEIPVIEHLSVGENFTDRAHGFTHGLVVQLRDRAALEAYAAHPGHLKVAAALAHDAEIRVLDYEFESPPS